MSETIEIYKANTTRFEYNANVSSLRKLFEIQASLR